MNAIDELIPTRQSLLLRLKDWGDEDSWKVFFDTYWKLIYNAGIKAGLTDAEAQDVVQETVLSVLKSMPGFDYDSTKGSFKNWLLRLTGWRILDQLRKRSPGGRQRPRDTRSNGQTETLEGLPDPAGLKLESTWDEEWEKNLMDAAIERVKRKVDPRQYQIFDLYVMKEWSVTRIARTMKVNPGRVYLAKHRVNGLIKKEISHLQAKPI